MHCRNRVGLLVLAAGVTLTLVGASWPLNPLVTRTSQPAGPVPEGCDESLAPPATPRVDVAEIPEREIIQPVASVPAPPPSRSLRAELEGAHTALANNDRPAFNERLRAARELLATYPPGEERSRAEEVLWALQDAAVLWDAQFESPFFDETSDAYTRVSRYAGYGDAVRRSVLTDDRDRRFYPAAESRDFITRVAAERLQRLGIRSTATPPPRVARAEAPRPSPSVSTPRRAPSPTPRRTTTRSPRRSSPSIAKSSKPAAPAKSAPSSSPDPSDAASPAPAEPAPTAPPASASGATADAPASPVAESTAPPASVTEDPATPAATDSATTTAAPVTTTTAEPAVPGAVPTERRSVLVPALLILIGLGVLIVLFRASK